MFEDAAINEIAALAAEVNESVENIGARRLYTIISHVVSDISFHAAGRQKDALAAGKPCHEEVITADYVRSKVPHKKLNLNQYVL